MRPLEKDAKEVVIGATSASDTLPVRGNPDSVDSTNEVKSEREQQRGPASAAESGRPASPSPADQRTRDAVVTPSKLTDNAAADANLTPDERHVLSRQLDSPAAKVNFFALYRFADTWDCLIIAISVACAIIAGAALPLLAILFGQLTSAFRDRALDTISYDDFESKLVRNVLYFVYFGIAEFATTYISTVGFIYAGEHIAQNIREQYLKAVLRQNMAYFDNIGAGEITTHITAQTNLIQDGISQKVGLTLTAIATFFTAFIIAYATYWKLALICTSTIVCMLLAMGTCSHFIVKFAMQSLQSYAVGGSVAQEAISSIRTATAFGTQERLAQQYEAHLKVAERHGVRMQMIHALMVGCLYAIMFLNYGLGFWQGSRFLVDGEVQVGQVLTILMSMVTGSYALGNVSPNIQAFTNAVAASAKIYSVIDRQSPLDPTSKDGQTLDHVVGAVELRGIKHVYPSRPDVTVMDNVTLSIPAGRVTAIVGPSGSGKSTIVGLIERFYSPVGGEVTLDGHNIQSLNLRWLRQQVSLVSQEPTLFSTTIFQNIMFGLIGSPFENDNQDELRTRIEDAAKTANAHDFITSLPDGYDTQVGEQGFLLSGGQKQRVAIARAIVSDPKVLLLDEATSALDTKSEEVVQAALDKAAKGRTTIVIAHRLSTIKAAHNIVVLVDGKIVEQGTHDELLDADGEYSKLVEAQRFSKDKNTQIIEEEESVPDEQTLTENEKNTLTLAEDSASSDLIDDEKSPHNLDKVRTARSRASNAPTNVAPESHQRYSLWTLVRFVASLNRLELKIMIIGFVFAILAGGSQPVQAVFYSKGLNTLSLPQNMYGKLRHDANFWSLMLLALGIIQFFLYLIQGVSLGIGSEKLIRRARGMAFRSILRQDIAFFDKDENSVGALTSFLSTETKHLSGISGVTLGTILMVSTTLTASLVIALALGWKLALVCISVVPVLLFCGYWRVSMLAEFQARSQKAYEASASYACEATSAIRTVASLTREDDVLATYHAQLKRQTRASLITVLKSSLFYALSQALSFFCMALGFWYGGTLLGKHEYTIFQFFVCFSEVIYGAQAAGSVFSNAPDMGKAKNAASAFKTLFDRRPSIDVWSDDGEEVNDVKGAIEFRNVQFRYPTRSAHPVLAGLSLSVKPGQHVALVGASGCGKSTTIALLERFYDATSGGIYVDGKDISTLNVNSYRSHIALVSQEPTLYQGTIRDNILLGSSDSNVAEDAINQACKEANIYDFVMSLPEGLETVVGSKGSMLSGGQKQRIAIARALLRDPSILLLDEATSALDSEAEKVVQAALDGAARGRTTIAVAHRLSTIQKADIIFVFDHGRIVEKGTHHELIQTKGRYYELVNLQSLGKTQ